MNAIVHCQQGAIRGATTAAVSVFKGIPYAAAPVGECRFRAPRPPRPHAGVLEANTFGATAPAPPQRSAALARLLPDPMFEGENQLNLNIWTPDVQGRFPVLVWIHGGGFVTGSGATSVYDGFAFARDGVVAVTINYRLAADGFLLIGDAVPNRGLLDQIAALQWVRDNIASFGGDPDAVTVCGQSAGAMSVATLLTMPRARGLFQRAVIQSGSAHHVHTVPEARLVCSELCGELGIDDNVGAISAVPVGTIHTALNRVIGRLSGGAPVPDVPKLRRLIMQPVVDGDILPADPMTALRGGAGSDVEVLIGTNTEEYDLFVTASGMGAIIDDTVLRRVVTRIGVDVETMIGHYRQLFPAASARDLFVTISSDWFCVIPTLRILQARTGQLAPTYAYEFGWHPATFEGCLGACHTLEIAFVFDTLADSWGAELRGQAPQALADDMHGAWVQFACGNGPGWAPYDREQPVRRFGGADDVVPNPAAGRSAIWDRYL